VCVALLSLRDASVDYLSCLAHTDALYIAHSLPPLTVRILVEKNCISKPFLYRRSPVCNNILPKTVLKNGLHRGSPEFGTLAVQIRLTEGRCFVPCAPTLFRLLTPPLLSTRWRTHFSSKVNLPHVIDCEALCDQTLVTLPSTIRTKEMLELHQWRTPQCG
jgi:hypothetical protein